MKISSTNENTIPFPPIPNELLNSISTNNHLK